MTSHAQPDWIFIRFATVGGWCRIAIYRKPDGAVAYVRA